MADASTTRPGEKLSSCRVVDGQDPRPPDDIVRSLVYRYCRALDRLDAALLRSCFHDDAEIDMGAIYQGPARGFIDVAMGFMGRMSATRHVVGNILAVGHGYESYVDAWHLIESEAGSKELLVRGRYLQRVAARSGCWAFSYHSEVVDFGSEAPANRGWFDTQRGLPKGARGGEDASIKVLVEGGQKK